MLQISPCGPSRRGLLIGGSPRTAVAEPAPDPSMVARGSYLAKAADCMPCHTSARDKSFAGGLRMNTPFGAIYSPNITPDRDTGIGAWTFDAFQQRRSLRHPCRRQVPLSSDAVRRFHEISEDDLKALWAYFRSVTPVKQPNRENELTFPFNIRYGMLAWRLLFFREQCLRARREQERAMEPRRLSGRGARPLRRLPHAAQLHGRDRRQQALSGRPDRPMVRARHHRRSSLQGQPLGQIPAHRFSGEGQRQQLDRARADAGGRARQSLVPDRERSRRHGQLPARSIERERRAEAEAGAGRKEACPRGRKARGEALRGQLRELPSGRWPGHCGLDPAGRRQSRRGGGQAVQRSCGGAAGHPGPRGSPGHAELCRLAQRRRRSQT